MRKTPDRLLLRTPDYLLCVLIAVNAAFIAVVGGAAIATLVVRMLAKRGGTGTVCSFVIARKVYMVGGVVNIVGADVFFLPSEYQ